MMADSALKLGRVLRHGLHRRCPRCGEGPLFRGWFAMRDICSDCGLIFEPTPGDTWGFWVLMDRVFLLAVIVALFVGVRPQTWAVRGVFFLIVAVPLVWTMPHRQGLAVALDYFIRTRTAPEDERQG
jgi:uncharacterized protein (DUF983 family)